MSTLKQKSEEAEKSIESAGEDAIKTATQNGECVLSCATDHIRKNPIAVVFGAVVFGIAVGILISSSRHEKTLRELYLDEPLDQASNLLDRASSTVSAFGSNLKFW